MFYFTPFYLSHQLIKRLYGTGYLGAHIHYVHMSKENMELIS